MNDRSSPVNGLTEEQRQNAPTMTLDPRYILPIEGNPNSLTYQIEQALLARHPVTLSREQARNYAELAASVIINDRLKLLAEIERLRGALGWLHEWSKTVTDLQNSDAHQ